MMKLLFSLIPLLSLTTSARLPYSVGSGYNSQSSQNNFLGGYNGNSGQGYGTSGSPYPSSSWSSNNNQGSSTNNRNSMFNMNLMRQALNNNNRNLNNMYDNNMNNMYDNNMNNINSMRYGSGYMNNMNNMYNNNNMNRMSRMTNMKSMYDNNNYNSYNRMGSTPGGYNSFSFTDIDVQRACDYVEHHTNSLTQSSKLLKAVSADRVSKQINNGIHYKFEGLRFYKTQCDGYASYNGQDMGFNQWWMNHSNQQQCQPQSATEFTKCDATVWWNPRGTPEYQVTQWRCR